jgi:phospholipid-binding lipoprotein MlaA
MRTFENKFLMKLFSAPQALFWALLLVAGCSSIPEEQRSDLRDQHENSNRKVFAFNMEVDTYVLEPAAKAYIDTVPEGAKRAISNHLQWAGMPSTALNSTLQGKFENAGLATLNFLVNGLTLGFADLADDDTPILKEDFGQTLAAANMPEGSYLMVPLLGPQTTRSLTGTVVDMIVNPYGKLAAGANASNAATIKTPLNAVTFRAKTFDAFNTVKYDSLDPYARTRSIYYQARQGLLDDKTMPEIGVSDSDDEFDAFFESAE